jgi:hypothetical protein
MSQDSINFLVDPERKYDRFVAATFGICFQLAEIMLIIGAFRYAGAKSGSLLLNSIASVLGFVGSLWLGLVLPGTIGRLKFWETTNSWVRYALTIAMIYASLYGTFLYMQAIALLATSQPGGPA